MNPTRWPPGRPRVLVTDAWLANAGDAAIAVATEALVREVAPSAAILHAAYGWRELADEVPNLRLVPALEHLLGTPWAPPERGWEASGRALVDDADIVLSQGGGFFIEDYEPRARAAALAATARAGTPVAVLGQTIGPMRGAALRRDLAAFLGSSPLVVVRDPASMHHAADLGARNPVLGTDLALSLPPAITTAERRGIGVVLTDHHPAEDRKADRRAAAAALLAAVVDIVPDEPVLCFSTVQGLPDLAGEDDAEVARAAVAALAGPEQRRITTVPDHLGPDEVMSLVGSARVLLTMRLHPALFAAMSGTPFALVLDGQRCGVLAGSALADLVAPPDDAAAVAAGVRHAVRDLAIGDTRDAAAPLLERLQVIRAGLAELLAPFTSMGGGTRDGAYPSGP